MSYVDEVYSMVVEKNPAQPEFHQAVKEVFKNLMIPKFTEGCKRSPPLYGPIALLNCTRNALLICTCPLSSTHGTRKSNCL